MQTHIWWWNFPPPMWVHPPPYGLPWDLASILKYQQTLANRDSGVLARVSIQVNRAFYQAQVQLICNYRWKIEKVGALGVTIRGKNLG